MASMWDLGVSSSSSGRAEPSICSGYLTSSQQWSLKANSDHVIHYLKTLQDFPDVLRINNKILNLLRDIQGPVRPATTYFFRFFFTSLSHFNINLSHALCSYPPQNHYNVILRMQLPFFSQYFPPGPHLWPVGHCTLTGLSGCTPALVDTRYTQMKTRYFALFTIVGWGLLNSSGSNSRALAWDKQGLLPSTKLPNTHINHLWHFICLIQFWDLD